MIQNISKAIIAPFVLLFSFLGIHAQPAQAPQPMPPMSVMSPMPSAPVVYGAALPAGTAVFETSLASPMDANVTSMTLAANAVRGGGVLIGYACFVIDEGSSQAETTCGQVSGTSVTGLQRGISQSTGTTTVAALQFSHRRGANVKIADFPLIQILKAQNNGEDTFPNPLFYDTRVVVSALSATNTIPTKDYVDKQVTSGCANAAASTKGCVQTATGAQAAAGTVVGSTGALLALPASLGTSTCQVIQNSVIVASTTTGKIDQGCVDQKASYNWTGTQNFSGTTTLSGTTALTGKVNGSVLSSLIASSTFSGTPQAFFVTSAGTAALVDSSNAASSSFNGFAVSSASAGQTVQVQTDGAISGFSGLISGTDYYASTTGTISSSQGLNEVYVGRAISSTQILINKYRDLQYNGTFNVSSVLCSGGGSTYTPTLPSGTRFIVADVTCVSSGPITGSIEFQLDTTHHTSTTIAVAVANSTSMLVTASTNTTTFTINPQQGGTGSASGQVNLYYYR